MSMAKLTPKRALWMMFLLQAACSLGLLFIAIDLQARETHLMNMQQAMLASDERARAHIQTEHDIEQLRTAALHIQNASNLTWDSLVEVTRWADLGIWSFFVSSVAIAFIGGCMVYKFRVRNSSLLSSAP
jgi:hypothetical protein